MDSFPWWVCVLIGGCFGVFVGFIIGMVAMQKLSEAERFANKK